MVKKSLTVSVANRTIGGKTESRFKLEGSVTQKVTNAIGDEAAEVLETAISSFGREGANKIGKDSKAFGAYLQNLTKDMLRAVGEGKDTVSRFRRAAISQLMDGTAEGYRASRNATPEKYEGRDKILANRLTAAQSKAERLQALIARTSNEKRKANLKASLAETKKLQRSYEDKERAKHAREVRIRLSKDPENQFGREVDLTFYEKRVKPVGTRKAIRYDAVGGFKLSDIKGKHDSVNKDTVKELKKHLEDRGVKFTKHESAEWENDKLPSLPATTLVQKMGGYFDISNPKTEEEKRLANDELYQEAYALSLLEIADFGEGDSRQAEQNIRAKLGRDYNFVMKQVAQAERSNKKQGLGAGSRGGKVKPATQEPTPKDASVETPKAEEPTKPTPVETKPVEATAKPEPVASPAAGKKDKKAGSGKKADAAKPKAAKKMPITDIKSKPLFGDNGLFASEADFDTYKQQAGFDDLSKKQLARFFAETPVAKATKTSKYVIAPPSPEASPEEAAQTERLRKNILTYQKASGKIKEAVGNMLKKAGFEDPDRLVLAENVKPQAKKEVLFDDMGYAPAQLLTPFINKYFPKQSKEGLALAKEISKVKSNNPAGLDELAKKHTWEGASAVIEFAKKLNEYARNKHESR